MTAKQLIKLGFPPGPALGEAIRAVQAASEQLQRKEIKRELKKILDDAAAHVEHPFFGSVARALVDQTHRATAPLRDSPAPWHIWGENLEPDAVRQLQNAAMLPISVRAALMPDAHVGYGLPIGGVLATDNAVIPYAVGVDIACRMKLSVLDIPSSQLARWRDTLVRALEEQTLFGVGKAFRTPLDHPVLDEDWGVSPVTRAQFDKARGQLGTSGSGNHFVEFGILTLDRPELDLEPGEYLALLSHSGSRGTGAAVADHYSRLAMNVHRDLPPELRRLAWLDLDTDPGREYWRAMELMGRYAAANHALVHQRVARAVGARVIAGVENHHNFAWKEVHDGREVIVHRKGATPAGEGVLGMIPGSMATPGFVVRGKGSAESLRSASHGAGRRMSRTAASKQFRWAHFKDVLERAGVQLLSAGIDEAPAVYKDIHQVMALQSDLVEVIARFDPRIVKMAPAGERAED